MELIGRKIGHIRLDALLAEGGMGAVYRGFDERLRRPVAVKVLRHHHRFEPESRARFVREARILSKLNHPGICQVYDLVEGRDADLLILELIEGKTLRQLAPEMDDATKLRVAEAVAEAIAAAHRARIVHRDLKPENVMVTPEGAVKVLDFGLARSVEGRRAAFGGGGGGGGGGEAGEAAGTGGESGGTPVPGVGEAGSEVATVVAGRGELPAWSEPPAPDATFYTLRDGTLGTVGYMSPEQARGDEVTEASDLYSFGIILQELFTGRKAYAPGPIQATMMRVAAGETVPVTGVDPELGELIEALEDPEPERRPSAADARDRLRRVRERPERLRRKRLGLAFLAAVLVALLAGAGAVVHSRWQARRQAEIAQRFLSEAHDVEWMMRAVHLSPPHDLRPARDRVRRRMEMLRERMEELGEIARGPGEHALGRAAIALGDFEAARGHLQRAWDAGYRLPEVASGLGLAMVELYQGELSRVARIRDPEERQRELRALRERLRDPAVGYLEIGRRRLLGDDAPPPSPPVTTRPEDRAGWPRLGELPPDEGVLAPGVAEVPGEGAPEPMLESLEYAEALIAFSEERYVEALARAREASRRLPWFYQGPLLEGEIHRALGERKEASGDYDAAAEDYRRARRALLEAAEVGRSDPAVYLELCDLGVAEMLLEIFGRGGELTAPFEEGVAACEQALQVDPESAVATRLLAELHLRMGERESERGNDPRPRLAVAASRAKEALARHPEDAASWRALGHVYSVRADWELVHGEDPRPSIEEMIAAYRRGLRHDPGDARLWNGIGNAHSMLAEYLGSRGDDPRPSVDQAVAAYRRASELDPEDSFPPANSAIALGTKALYELGHGLDPRATAERMRDALATTLDLNPRDARAYTLLADAHLVAARHQLRSGGDPGPALAAALEACDRADAIYVDSVYSYLARATAWLLRAEHDLRRGRDPAPSLAPAVAAAEEVLRIHPTRAQAYALLGAAHRVEAKSRLDGTAGGDPAEPLARAVEALDRALGITPELPDALLERGRAAVLEARLESRRGGDPGPAIERARELFRRLENRRPAVVEEALAELEFLHG